ncbi:MAG TPA: hypothetical protein PKC24_16345, partial [Cyclobacteriaceae bacterium]|nr:hypothetical protein [Cyclobacteriaceae bacterium]
ASAQIIESNGSGGGNWNDPLTWQGGIIPTASNSTQINIRTGDIVNIPSGFTAVADQLFVRESATLSVLSGGTLNIVNGSGNDLVLINNGALFGQLNVSGRLEFSHGATAVEGGAVPSSNTTATTMKILNGGVYNHGYTTYSGSIIGAEWQDGSVLEITSLTSASQIPSNLNQSFFDVVWNCPLQSKQLNLGGNLSEVRGTFRILSTGSQVLYIFGSQSSVILNIAGNFEISGNASVIFSTGNSNVISIGGDFIISTSSSTVQLARAGSLTINVLNSMNITSNTVLAAVSGNLSLNLTGDLVMSGNFAVQSGGVANLLFNGSSQNLAGSSFSGLFNFTIGSGATLNLGSHFLVSPGTFTMQSASTIMVGSSSPGGAIAANTSEGNIRIPVANRTYNANSRIVYNNGSVPQFLSSGHPS